MGTGGASISTALRVLAWAGLLLGVGAYVALVGRYVCLLHDSFFTQAFDLGIFDQALWLVSHGETPFVTVRGLHRFGDHVEFLLYPLAPLYWAWDDVRALLLAQTAALALGAVALFLLARRRLGHGPALAFALAWLLNPAVLNLNLDSVHAEAFGATALLLAFYFGSERRLGAMLLSCVVALSCKEDVAVTTAAFGLFVAARWNRRAGLALCLASVAWFLLCMEVLLPHYNGAGFFRFNAGWFVEFHQHKYDPLWYVRTVFQLKVLTYLLHLLAPLAFLPLLAPRVLLIAVPAIGINVLSNTDYLRSIDYHYMTSIMPFLFAAAVEGAARLRERPLVLALPFIRARRRGRLVRLTPMLWLSRPVFFPRLTLVLAATGVLGAAVAGNLLLSRLPLDQASATIQWHAARSRANPTVQAAREAAARIPPQAHLSADYLLLPHLSHRKRIYMFPNPFMPDNWGIHDENMHDPAGVEYILVHDTEPMLDEKKRLLLARLVADGEFREVINKNGIRLYRRVQGRQETACGT